MNKVYKKKFIPQNYLAEEILLGTIIIYPNLVFYIKNTLKKDYFFLESHEIIYINLLNNSNKNCNIIYFVYILKFHKVLNKIGGLRKIVNMMRQSQVFINSSKLNNYIEKLINILNHNYIKRLIIQYGNNIAKLGYVSLLQATHVRDKIKFYLNFVEREIKKNHTENRGITSIKELISIKLLKIKYPNIYRTNIETQSKTGLKFGFKKLDQITKGLPTSSLIIIAGRPSIGKTSFAINIAYNIFFYQHVSMCIFSLEMSTQEILDRFICISCQTDINKNNNLKLSIKQWKDIIIICQKLIQNNIYINDKYNIKINYIEHITENLKKNINFHLIIIDYLQLIEFSSEINKKLNRSQELGYITRRLKLLAQTLKIPIIVLSQLNRNIEIRSNKEPLLSDLKESGCIRYDSHINIKNLTKYVNIKNITSTQPNLIRQNNNWFKDKNIKQQKTILYFFIKNLAKLITSKCELELTHNHSYLSETSWQRLNLSIMSNKINKIKNNITINYPIVYKIYIQEIIFYKYYETYDINFNYEFHFLSKQMVLHNSIEQDSDIIIMLYHNSNSEKKPDNKAKLIDIKVSKNRNGHTGSCKIMFMPETTKFNEFTIDET
uniref:DNA 5'-3' helicase n=1 Tax=Laurencieae sp. TaxID=2007162 RepID=A0A1Z1M374_9FLOR|nr:Replication helicase subunit [Laurencieae sp.]